jgi:hypothetical protein
LAFGLVFGLVLGLVAVDAGLVGDGAGRVAGLVDGGLVDGGLVDGGLVDGGLVDGGLVDGGLVDGGVTVVSQPGVVILSSIRVTAAVLASARPLIVALASTVTEA